jgi:hypothetical protein
MITSTYNNLEGTIFHTWNHIKHTLHITPRHFTWRNLKNTSNNVAAAVVVVSCPWFLIDQFYEQFSFLYLFSVHIMSHIYTIFQHPWIFVQQQFRINVWSVFILAVVLFSQQKSCATWVMTCCWSLFLDIQSQFVIASVG